MRIDKLTLANFRCFDYREIEFNPQFNLLIGENSAGKTSLLDALSVAVGSWFLGIRGYGSRHIRHEEVRLVTIQQGSEVGFEEQYPVQLLAHGSVLGEPLVRYRELRSPEGRTTYANAWRIKELAWRTDRRVRRNEEAVLPLIAYYGTGRLWLEVRSQERKEEERGKRSLSRFEGYRNSIDPRCSPAELVRWLKRQAWISFQERKETIHLQVVRKAILGMLEGATDLRYDPRVEDIVVTFGDGGSQPFHNLSDGQRNLLALTGDLASRAARLNPHLEERILEETSGVVLIDEIDLHLHPKWQRRIVQDLRRTFPKVQFVATTHSPQVISEIEPEQVLLMTRDDVIRPDRTLGMDSNWILRHIMGTEDRPPEVAKALRRVEDLIRKSSFPAARREIKKQRQLGIDLPEWSILETRMKRIETLGE